MFARVTSSRRGAARLRRSAAGLVRASPDDEPEGERQQGEDPPGDASDAATSPWQVRSKSVSNPMRSSIIIIVPATRPGEISRHRQRSTFSAPSGSIAAPLLLSRNALVILPTALSTPSGTIRHRVGAGQVTQRSITKARAGGSGKPLGRETPTTVSYSQRNDRAAIPRQTTSQPARIARSAPSGATCVPFTMTCRRASPR